MIQTRARQYCVTYNNDIAAISVEEKSLWLRKKCDTTDKWIICSNPEDATLAELVCEVKKYRLSFTWRRNGWCAFHYPCPLSPHILVAHPISPSILSDEETEEDEAAQDTLFTVTKLLDDEDTLGDISMRGIEQKTMIHFPLPFRKCRQSNHANVSNLRTILAICTSFYRFNYEKEARKVYRSCYACRGEMSADLLGGQQDFHSHYENQKMSKGEKYSQNAVLVEDAIDDLNEHGLLQH